ncbi:YdcF family protein [Nocardia thraciensis]
MASGSKGSDEAVSEASAMADYLVARGVPVESDGSEERSTTTRENLRPGQRDSPSSRCADASSWLVCSAVR